jgi:hypothetical protein
MVMAIGALTIVSVPVVGQDGREGPDGQRGQRRDGERQAERQGERPGERQGGRQGERRGGRGGMIGRGVFNGRTGPEYLRRDVPRFVSLLELDEGQTTILEALLLEYEAAFNHGGEVVRAAMEEARPGSPEQEAERRALREDFGQVRREMRALREATPEGQEPDEAQMAEVRERMTAFRERATALRPTPEQIQDSRDMMRPALEKWQSDREALLADFVLNAQALLNDDQIELWPPFERTLRRDKALPRGRLSGERVNMFSVVRDLEFDDEINTALEQVLQEYAVAIDDALVKRDKQLETGREALMDALMAQDMERALALAQRDAAARVAVRDVNERYAQTLQETLAQNNGDAPTQRFRQAWLIEAYPRIYRPRLLDRTFAAAAELEGIDQEAGAAIAALQLGYSDDVAVRNERIMKLTRQEEPARTNRWIERRGPRGPNAEGGPQAERSQREDPVGQLYDARRQMEEEYRQRIEALLTPEQVEMLPQPPARDESRRQRWGEAGNWGRGDRDGERRPNRRDNDGGRQRPDRQDRGDTGDEPV